MLLRLSLFIILVLMHASCSPVGSPIEKTEQAGFIKVVCTTGMIADIARAVCGSCGEVEAIIGSGVDPHLYKPTRDDVVQLAGANMILYNGFHLEGKMTEVLIAQKKEKPVIAVAEETLVRRPDLAISENEDEGSQTDPHLWMDVQAWIETVDVVAEALAAYDPVHIDTYKANAQTYKEILVKLDAYATASLATVGLEQRVLVTAHDAFGYFGRAYSIDVRGIQGLSTESEAGLYDLKKLIDYIVERALPAVFVESSVADKNVRALVEGAAARGHLVSIGGELFSDAMGAPGTYEGTYIGMIDHNVTTIVNALGGVAAGFQEFD